jgi:heme-degrading monooxygenase HmoA
MAAEKAFAVIYRWSVEPEHEEYFRQRWRNGTLRLKRDFGALGSCLTRDANGDFVAFARWPSEAARDQAFAAIQPLEPWPGIRSFEETKLWVEEDHLTGS